MYEGYVMFKRSCRWINCGETEAATLFGTGLNGVSASQSFVALIGGRRAFAELGCQEKLVIRFSRSQAQSYTVLGLACFSALGPAPGC